MMMVMVLSMMAGTANADDSGPVLSLAGGVYLHNEATDLGNSWTALVRPGFQFNDAITLELDASYLEGSSNTGFEYWGMNPRLNLLWFPGDPSWAVHPFLAVGPGVGFVRNDWDDTMDIDLLINAGPGVRAPLAEWMSLRADARFMGNLGVFEGEPEITEGDLVNWEVTAGVMFHFYMEKDADGDGILDELDECPTEAEDIDQFEDKDGCPDPDNDGDSILDDDDECPEDAEDFDGFEDTDGCPEADNDGDGLLDADDSCPQKAGPEATKGCPDKDGDLVIDSRDKCPDKPRNPKIAPEKSNGCPAQKVALGAKKIEIYDKVFFATGSAVIKAESNPLLDEIAEVFNENPRIKKVQVEGHTDNVGNAAYNRTLSQQRAESVVKYLVKAGVDKDRLVAKGHGPDMPIADNKTDEGKASNRRVEFNILEQGKVRTGAEKDNENVEGKDSQGVEYVDEEKKDSGRERGK